MLTDVFFLVLLALSTLLFQLLGFPLFFFLLRGNTPQPEWWGWGRGIGWLFTGLLLWGIAHTGVPANTAGGLIIVLVGLGILQWRYILPKIQPQLRYFLRSHYQHILFQETLFIAGFVFLGFVRTYNPAILDLEKFMNAGLLQGYLRSPALPAIDPWLAGQTINYYSFGHFLGSVLIRFWQIPVEVGFNALLGWMMGLILVQVSALVSTLVRPFISRPSTPKPFILASVAAALLVVFGSNSHPLWHWLVQRNFEKYWFPDAVRFIEFTIHEFPAYSFIVSDLHAHFWSIPVVLLTIFTAWWWFQMVGRVKITKPLQLFFSPPIMSHSIVLGVLLGILGMTNTWDMVVYTALLCAIGCMAAAHSPRRLWVLIVSAIWTAGTAFLVLAPWLFHFTSIVNGIFLVEERSPLWQMAVLWTGHGILSTVATVTAVLFMRKNPDRFLPGMFIVGLGVVAWFFVLLPELVYFKDIYPTFPRANTMFKFTFQAFILMSLLAGWLLGFLFSSPSFLSKRTRVFWIVLLLIFLTGALSYPFKGYSSYYGGFEQRRSLDGMGWLRSTRPAEYEAILWLRSHVHGRPVVLEAVGDSYSQSSRVSVFSGLPTVLGWRAHEWLWRGGYEIPRQRTEEVRVVYESARSASALSILKKYEVQFIFIGQQEREAYDIDMTGLANFGTIVFQRGDVVIIETQL